MKHTYSIRILYSYFVFVQSICTLFPERNTLSVVSERQPASVQSSYSSRATRKIMHFLFSLSLSETGFDFYVKTFHVFSLIFSYYMTFPEVLITFVFLRSLFLAFIIENQHLLLKISIYFKLHLLLDCSFRLIVLLS